MEKKTSRHPASNHGRPFMQRPYKSLWNNFFKARQSGLVLLKNKAWFGDLR